MERKTILVTGAAGFIGGHVAGLYAKQGWHVIGLGHGVLSQLEQARIGLTEWHSHDVSLSVLKEYAGRPWIVIHCAGGSLVGASIEEPYHDFQRSVLSTVDLLEFVRLYSPETRVVFPSSAAVYGATLDLPITERSPFVPVSPYGTHKMMVEAFCRSYAKLYKVKVAVVRLFSIYGPGLRKQILWDACNKIQRGNPTFWGTGDERRDWLHVNDAVALLERAGDMASARCPVVNGGTGISASVRDVVEGLISGFGTDTKPSFTGSFRSGDPEEYLADITAALAWGWKPTINWQDGVTEYAQWFQRENQ